MNKDWMESGQLFEEPMRGRSSRDDAITACSDTNVTDGGFKKGEMLMRKMKISERNTIWREKKIEVGKEKTRGREVLAGRASGSAARDVISLVEVSVKHRELQPIMPYASQVESFLGQMAESDRPPGFFPARAERDKPSRPQCLH